MKAFILDKTGREILPGDILKIFHFSSRNKRYYMHKQVVKVRLLGEKKRAFLLISHLSSRKQKGSDDTYFELMDGQIHDDIEIVQGFGRDGKRDWMDRPKLKPMEEK